MPLPPVRYWEVPPQYDITQDMTGGELPDDFDYAQMLTDPGGGPYGTGPMQHMTWAEYFSDYFGYAPTGDGIKSAVSNVMDRTKYNPAEAQQAYDMVLFMDPDTGATIAPGNPGDSLLEQGTLATMEKMGLRPSHLYGTPTFYSIDLRSGRNQITKWALDPNTGQWTEEVIWEAEQENDRGAHTIAMQQLAAQMGLTPEQLSEWQRTGFLAVYPYPAGDAPGGGGEVMLDAYGQPLPAGVPEGARPNQDGSYTDPNGMVWRPENMGGPEPEWVPYDQRAYIYQYGDPNGGTAADGFAGGGGAAAGGMPPYDPNAHDEGYVAGLEEGGARVPGGYQGAGTPEPGAGEGGIYGQPEESDRELYGQSNMNIGYGAQGMAGGAGAGLPRGGPVPDWARIRNNLQMFGYGPGFDYASDPKLAPYLDLLQIPGYPSPPNT